MKKGNEYQYLGIILDSKLSFAAHIKSAISKTRKGIGLLKYLPRQMNHISSMYHPNYGDVIYHIPAKICQLSQNLFIGLSLLTQLIVGPAN